MSGGEVGSYQELAFDPVYFEDAGCDDCGGERDDDRRLCEDCSDDE